MKPKKPKCYTGRYLPVYFCFDCGRAVSSDMLVDGKKSYYYIVCDECQKHYDQQSLEASKADTKQSKKEGW